MKGNNAEEDDGDANGVDAETLRNATPVQQQWPRHPYITHPTAMTGWRAFLGGQLSWYDYDTFFNLIGEYLKANAVPQNVVCNYR